jgi:hypothetical protein
MRVMLLSGVVWACALTSVPAAAHHSQAAFYDVTNVGDFEGEVTAVFWQNPHVRFNVLRRLESGETELWLLESNSVNTLSRLGIMDAVVAVGDQVRVAGILSRHGLKEMRVTNVLLPSGQEVVLMPNLIAEGPRWTAAAPRTPAPAAPATASAAPAARGFFRIWASGMRPNTITADETLPLSASANAAREAWNPLTDDVSLRCEPPGMPAMMFNPYPIEFVDRGDSIELRLEEWDGLRTIHVKRIPAAPATPILRGFSVGHWENEHTLLVTTTQVSWPYYDDFGTPQSAAVRIVERFTLNPAEDRLDYTATVTDRATFTEPVTTSTYWHWVPGETLKPYRCALWENSERPAQ